MQICAFGYRNLVLLGSLTADQAVAGLPVSNLQLPQGAASLAWRSPVLTVTLTLTLSQVETVRAVSVHRTNLSAQASWTVVVLRAGVVDVSRFSSGRLRPKMVIKETWNGTSL